MSALDAAPHVQPLDRAEWRRWLAQNHDVSTGVWVVTYKKAARKPSPTYEDLVLEALCFGWIDSTARRVDDERTRLYLCPRKKGGGWAATNKARIEALLDAGLMTPAGQAVIDQAKADGSWTALDRSEALELPDELRAALSRWAGGLAAFDAQTPSARKQLIYRVDSAKRPETRLRRADDIAKELGAP